MNQRDKQSLESIRYTIQQDALVREDIKRAIEYHDRAFFEQVVYTVIDRLQLTVSDMRGFINSAYEWFRNRL